MPFKKKDSYHKQLDKLTEQIDKIIVGKKDDSISRISGIVANFSQVIMLVVVIYGYFTTVLPVIQKEQISEELAALELEKSSWMKKIDLINKELIEKSKELSDIQENKATLISEVNALNNEKYELKNSLSKTKSEYNTTIKELRNAKSNLSKALDNLLELNKNAITGNIRIPAGMIARVNDQKSPIEIFDFKKSNIEQELKESYLQPMNYVSQTISYLEKELQNTNSIDKKIKTDILNQYKSGILKNKNLLTCPEPNFNNWATTFYSYKNIPSELVAACVDFEFDKRAKEEKWTHEEINELKKVEFWKEQSSIYASSCKISIELHLITTFSDQWSAAIAPCHQRLIDLDSIVLGQTPAKDLKSFSSMNPPSKELITSKIKSEIFR